MQGELRQVADLALFAKIVQTGGISRCAADLGMERTTISRRLGALEKTLGVKLLDRSPKHIAVTDAGRRCLEQCELLLESAHNATSLATMGAILADSSPIVVGAPPDMIDRYLDRWLVAFETENPRVNIERRPITVWSEESVESVDLGISLAPVPANIAWTNSVASVRQSIFSSADYCSRHGTLASPLDLEAHNCIVESSESDRHAWRFERNGKTTTVSVNARYIVSCLLEAREATLAGLGVCRLPQYLCEPYLQAGRLVDLLPDTESTGRDVVLLTPRQKQRKTGITALRIYLENAFGESQA